jgi:glycosyltransferase involved in cell wall biosynthesis
MTKTGGDPTVSVIVPSYNTAGYITECLESVFAQTYRDYEVIVVNDGSPDTPALEQALAPFRDRIVYLTQKNQGLAGARNTAIAAARGRYVALLDSDDAWLPEYLQVQVAALDADPSVDAIYPNAIIFGDHPLAGRTYMDVCPSDGPVTFESLLTQRSYVMVSLMARRDALVRAGLFDASLRSSEDFDLWVRLVTQGSRIAYHRQVLVRFRKRRDSLSADPVWMADHALLVLDKLDRTLPLDDEDRRVLRERQAYFRAARHLAQGKRAFFNRRQNEAIAHLARANDYFRTPRLTLAAALIRRVPGLLLKLYDWRDRLIVGSSTRS